MDVMKAIRTRRSVRAYADKEIPPDTMNRMREALRSAPSVCNYQPVHFIFVTDPELRRELAKSADDQLWMANAPVIVVACGFPEQAYKNMAGYGNSVDIDTAIALDHLTLAATADGLGTCWIGSFSEAGVKTLLNVPHSAKVVAMTPLGYPTPGASLETGTDAERKPPAELFSLNAFGNTFGTN